MLLNTLRSIAQVPTMKNDLPPDTSSAEAANPFSDGYNGVTCLRQKDDQAFQAKIANWTWLSIKDQAGRFACHVACF